MASNIFSRLLPSASDDPYLYEESSTHHRDDRPRNDHHLHMDIDDENFGEQFEEQDLENLLADAATSHITTESTAFLSAPADRRPGGQPSHATSSKQPWRQPSSARRVPSDEDDDVPESLLLEGDRHASPTVDQTRRHTPNQSLPPPVPGPSTRQARAQWDTTRMQQRLHDEGHNVIPAPRWAIPSMTGQLTMDPKERALWLWANVQDLDAFLHEVYDYYIGAGIWSTVLRRVINLIQTAFVVGFTTFLTYCIDYKKLPKEHSIRNALIPKCTSNIHGIWTFLIWGFSMYWTWSLVSLVRDIPRLQTMHNFFHYALDIKDRDIQTVQWKQVVDRLVTLRDANFATASNLPPETRKILEDKSRVNIDALDIANRIMRRDNYLIALFNKELLNVTVNFPFGMKRQVFSQTTEWHVRLAVMDFVFNEKGQINPDFLKERNRRDLVAKLRKRFVMVGVLSCFCAPITVTYVLVSYVFKYFSQYHKDPSQLGTRDFTPFAQWKFREFNELPHIFDKRRKLSYPYADAYLSQFPRDKMEQLSALVAFISGAFATVLIIFSTVDSELFLGVEVTPGKTVLFYITLFGAVYAAARGGSPREDQTPDPDLYMGEIIRFTRYEPAHWHNRWHTEEVRLEFAAMYQPKVMIFVEEIISMVITPFLLITKLPHSSASIVDFFREFTVHVDGLGNVCSFAMFDFKKGGDNAPANRATREDTDLRAEYYNAKDNKMMASYYGFQNEYSAQTRGHLPGRLQTRSNFHPPPPFPATFAGMPSLMQRSELGIRTTSKDPTRQLVPRRTPHHVAGGRGSPVNSISFDSQHQPSTSMHRNSPRQVAQSRYRSSLQPVSNPDEDEDLPGPSRQTQLSQVEEDSSIGGSWKTSRLAQDENEEDGGGGGQGGNRGGVLHLLHQFSKAQAEGKGAGVGI
ncbi:membrane protein Gsa14p [Delitschia confertaspora ATCC 74209]|uniref:Autophagy-related protein 9 n=1 Tax=Delitschia confertaspora ATCC 74209 TaxID=1513339 RepID=A0A9P4MME0_9PLEO|nr:membrane protein Gsa14p [Delitschia confertaspora ATCC 74209]